MTRTGLSRAQCAGRIALALVFIHSMLLSPAAWAGAFIFAGESYGVDLILHPAGYTGSGGTLNLGVCIDPASQRRDDLVIPVQNNIAVWNDLQPVASNVQMGAVSGIDAESVLLHELGHCIGLAHVNAASESGLSGSNTDYTKATDGSNNIWNLNAGPDGVIGSHDDQRGDDVNLHWFNPANDPFLLPIATPVDTSQYKRDLSFLPAGDSFAQNASRSVASAMGYPSSEAVMQQGTYSGETQRELVSDDASTIMLAASGVDEIAGTGDDYQIVLSYEGFSTGPECDITVILEDMAGLAYCSVGGGSIASNHWRIGSASIHLGAGYTYHFNTEPRGGGNRAPTASNDSAGVAEDDVVDIDVLANDSDPDSDALSVTGVSNPPNGSASVNADDSIRYTPDANYNGADSFSYTISDGNGGSDSAIVNVTVSPVNDLPVALDDGPVTVAYETATDIDVLANDSDVDGDTLNVESTGNGAGGTVTNQGAYVTYQPNAGFSGVDSFEYTVGDGVPGSTDTATVTLNVSAPNLPPTASFTSSCTGLSCTFDAAASSDPDGSIVSYSWDFGDGASGSGQQPGHSYAAAGTYTVVLTVEDDQAATGSHSAAVTVTPGPSYAVADWQTVQGDVSGTYLATHAGDGSVQSVTETHSGGKPSNRSDSLEHIWQFNLPAGNQVFNVDATADFPAGDADSVFLFQWSGSANGPWQDMVSVSASSGGYQSQAVGSASGTVYVRVIDENEPQGNTVYSTVSIDHMFFDAPEPPTEPPAAASAPDPADGAAEVPVNAVLSWSAGMGAELHDVYFGTAPDALSLVSEDQAGTSFDPGGLDTSQLYFWRVDEQNIVGTTTGTVWQFTTSSVSGPTHLVVESIVPGTVNAGKGQKRGQAVVTVTDNQGSTIEGLTVTGTFTGSYNEPASGDTGPGGAATLTTGAAVKGGVSFTFCVDAGGITGSALPYEPAAPDCATF